MKDQHRANSMLLWSLKNSMTLGYFHIRDDQSAYLIRPDEFILLNPTSLPKLRDGDHILIIPKGVVFGENERLSLINCKHNKKLDTIQLTKALEAFFVECRITLSTPIVLAVFSDRYSRLKTQLGAFSRFYAVSKFYECAHAYFKAIFSTTRNNYKKSSYGFVHSPESLSSYSTAIVQTPKMCKQEEYIKSAQEKQIKIPDIIKLIINDPLAVAVLTQTSSKGLSVFRIRQDQEALVLSRKGNLVRVARKATPALEDNDLLFIVSEKIVTKLVEKEGALQEIVKDKSRDSETVLDAILEIVAILIKPIGKTIPTFIALFKVRDK